MKLKILGSSSNGNCYVLETRNESLIIECGVRLSRIKRALDWWKSHATLTPLAKQDCPLWLQYD